MSLETIKLEANPGEIKPYKDQDYYELKSQHNESNLFEDDSFPATVSSLYYSKEPPAGIRWMRPREACSNPQFVVDGYDRADLDQGKVGNCWFIAACSGIAQRPKLLSKVVPQDQNFTDDYAGIFHFRFFLYGEWVDVVVDDRLPYSSNGKLLFCSNKQQPNEYWGPLLEKAYAKIYGNYQNLAGGQTFDGFIDMSGGVQELFKLKKLTDEERSNMWYILNKAFDMDSIMGSILNADPAVVEAKLPNGLYRGHAYTITKLATVGDTDIIRLRNPWGNDAEWNGPWSDGSAEWNSVSEEEKQASGFVIDGDGEFWMSFNDFLDIWDSLQICHLSMDSYSSELLEDDDADLAWKCVTYHSAWIVGQSNGGSGENDTEKFWTNPQFLINLSETNSADGKCDIVIALMQKDTRLRRAKTKQKNAFDFIQFRLFRVNDDVEVDDNKSSGLKLYANQLEKIGDSGTYINLREVTKGFKIDPGHYLIIPSTQNDTQDVQFMLRIFTEQHISTHNLYEDKDKLEEDEHMIVLDEADLGSEEWINVLLKELKIDRTDCVFSVGES